MLQIQSPHRYVGIVPGMKVFLAGSIEMDTAENWQMRVIESLHDADVTLYNPRRDDWDNTITQSINDPRFKEQVNWELDAIDDAAIVVMYFDPNAKSPITLLEFGLLAQSKKLIVACPDGFWRKGNVEVVCERWGIPLFNTLEELIAELKARIEQ